MIYSFLFLLLISHEVIENPITGPIFYKKKSRLAVYQNNKVRVKCGEWKMCLIVPLLIYNFSTELTLGNSNVRLMLAG